MRNQKELLIVAGACIVVAIILFFYNVVEIPNIAKKERAKLAMENSMTDVVTVLDPAGIEAGAMITEDMFKNKVLGVVQASRAFLPKVDVADAKGKTEGDAVIVATSKEELLGKVTLRELNYKEYVMLASVSKEKEMSDERQFERLREVTLNNTIGGELKDGNLVDILLTYEDGDYDVVIPKIKIKKIVETQPANQQANTSQANGSAAAATTTNNQSNINGPVMVVLPLTEGQYRDIELAKRIGKLEARLYVDDIQCPSMATFKYGDMKNIIIRMARDYGLKGTIEAYNKEEFMGFAGDKWDIDTKLLDKLKLYKDQILQKKYEEQQKRDEEQRKLAEEAKQAKQAQEQKKK